VIPDLNTLYFDLGITNEYLGTVLLPRHQECLHLVVAGIGPDNKEKLLTPLAAAAWNEMQSAALRDGFSLWLYSGFRSFEYQAALIKRRLDKGEELLSALTRLAPPGYSEHHTGRAIDITCEAFPHPDQNFDTSDEYLWLDKNASTFGFGLSYPVGNLTGIIYEPWHWCFLG